MGWKFWQSEGGKSKGKGKGRGSSTRGRKKKPAKAWDPKRTLQGVQGMTLVAVAIAGVLAWQHGKSALKNHVAERAPVELTADHVELADAPSWMTEAWRRDVRRTAAAWVKPDPFDGRSLAVAAEALEADPLVKTVHQVRRLEGGRVRVEATYRSPLAVIESDRGYHLVDEDGVVLPGVYRRRHLSALGLPVIVGADTQPPLKPGGRWTGDGVAAGLRLAGTLLGEPFESEVKAIDVSHRTGGHVDLYLLTPDGPVRWGRPPGMEHSVEPEAGLKLKRLRHLARQSGSIALPGRVVEVNGPSAQSVEIHLLPEVDRPRATPAF